MGGSGEGEGRILVFELEIAIRWGDMDAMGHVNNTVYFRYFETIRIEWMHSVVGPPDKDGEGAVIVKIIGNDKGNPPGKLADAELHFLPLTL